jgi:hypothetical protein
MDAKVVQNKIVQRNLYQWLCGCILLTLLLFLQVSPNLKCNAGQ